MKECPICNSALRWNQLAIDLNIEEFIKSNPNSIECLVTENGKLKKEESFFSESDEGETVITIPTIETTQKSKKVFEVGLEANESEIGQKRKASEIENNETKLGKKRYYSDMEKRKQQIEQQKQNKKIKQDEERLKIMVKRQQKRQLGRIQFQNDMKRHQAKQKPSETIIIE